MATKLLFDIARCENCQTPSLFVDLNHPCNEVVVFQRKKGVSANYDFQIPEPWSGDIMLAPILIISSNPAISYEELYPTQSWPDSMITDFFHNRFKDRGKRYSWVYQNKVLNQDGSRGKSVRYWSGIKCRVEELLGRLSIPGKDYCITELVHCKSMNQIGVRNALPECTKRFFQKKIHISGAVLIIAIGSFVRNYFREVKAINDIPVIYLPHPNAFEPKKFSDHYSITEINGFRSLLVANERDMLTVASDINLPNETEIINFIDNRISKFNNPH